MSAGGGLNACLWATIAAMMRQIRKQILTLTQGLVVGLMLAIAPGAAPAAPIVTTTVTDPLSGVALDGYDPVTYFTETEPQPGSPEFEFYWAGVPWYFASEANRDVFIRAPDVYAPQFGGYCAMSLARGYLSDGNPRVFSIYQMKLYVFYSVANREAFLLARGEAVARAGEGWQKLSPSLVGPREEPAVALLGNSGQAASR